MPKIVTPPRVHHLTASALALAGMMSDPGWRGYFQTIMGDSMAYPVEYQTLASCLYDMMSKADWRNQPISWDAFMRALNIPTDHPLMNEVGTVNRARQEWNDTRAGEVFQTLYEWRGYSTVAHSAELGLSLLKAGHHPDQVKQRMMEDLATADSVGKSLPMKAIDFVEDAFDSIGKPAKPPFLFQRFPMHLLVPAVDDLMTVAIEGPPGNRKTAMIMNWLLEAAFQQRHSLIALLESERRPFILGMLSALTNEILYQRGEVLSTNELTLRTAGLPTSGPIAQAGEIAKQIIREQLAPYWQVVGMSDKVIEVGVLQRKFYQALDNQPEIAFFFVDPANYLIARDEKGYIHDSIFERTEAQAAFMLSIKELGVTPVFGWHTNKDGGAAGGENLPRRLNLRIKIEYNGDPIMLGKRYNVGTLKLWVEKGREVAMGKDITEKTFYIDRASGLAVAYHQDRVDFGSEGENACPVCMIPYPVLHHYNV